MTYQQSLVLTALALVQISCGGGGGSTTPNNTTVNSGNNNPGPVEPAPVDPGPIGPDFSESPFVMQSATYSAQLAISASTGSAASSRYQSTHKISLTHTQPNH